MSHAPELPERFRKSSLLARHPDPNEIWDAAWADGHDQGAKDRVRTRRLGEELAEIGRALGATPQAALSLDENVKRAAEYLENVRRRVAELKRELTGLARELALPRPEGASVLDELRGVAEHVESLKLRKKTLEESIGETGLGALELAQAGQLQVFLEELLRHPGLARAGGFSIQAGEWPAGSRSEAEG